MKVKVPNLFIIALSVLSLPLMAFGQDRGLDERINAAFQPIADWWGWLIFYPLPFAPPFNLPIVLVLLVFGASFFTVAFGFVNIRRFLLAINVVRGKYDDIEMAGDPDHKEPHSEHADVNIVDGDIVDTIKDEGHHGEVNHF
ncbi:MAG: hypothetical protein AAB288_06610, partial [Acidobacteriota bacterium]